jgi:hypothetical protein
MLQIEYKGITAVWTSKTRRWSSVDKDFQDLLNSESLLPDEEEFSVSDSFREGGLETLYLKSIRLVLGNDVKVVTHETNPQPEEKAGVVY